MPKTNSISQQPHRTSENWQNSFPKQSKRTDRQEDQTLFNSSRNQVCSIDGFFNRISPLLPFNKSRPCVTSCLNQTLITFSNYSRDQTKAAIGNDVLRNIIPKSVQGVCKAAVDPLSMKFISTFWCVTFDGIPLSFIATNLSAASEPIRFAGNLIVVSPGSI